jgi:hypothetical protein
LIGNFHKKKAITRCLRMMAWVNAFLHSGYDIRSCSTGIVVMPVTVTTTVTNELRMGRSVIGGGILPSRAS